MYSNKILGWFSMGFFIVAILLIVFVGVLLLFPTLQASLKVDAQFLFLSSDVLALFAVIFGFFSRATRPGKVGEIGGLVMFIPLTIFLSWITVTGTTTQVISY